MELKICGAQGREGLPQAEEAHLAEVLAALELVDLVARRRCLRHPLDQEQQVLPKSAVSGQSLPTSLPHVSTSVSFCASENYM